jgi:hypothetical protein
MIVSGAIVPKEKPVIVDANTEPEMLKIGEFANRMRISIHTARQWSYRRRFTTVRSGKLILIPSTEVARLMKEATRPHWAGTDAAA